MMRQRLISFLRREEGASLVEYTIVISPFLLIFFALLDFGRLGFNWVMTEKAMQRAVRIAATRPPVCAGVPETHRRGSNHSVAYGKLCRAEAGVCANEQDRECVLNVSPMLAAMVDYDSECPVVSNADTATEIWCLMWPILPANASPRNVRMSYSHDGNLGFLGGPYTPMVEVSVVTAEHVDAGLNDAEALRFSFITPLPGFMALAAGAAPGNITDSGSDGLADIPFPDLSVSMPAEDLSQGNSG